MSDQPNYQLSDVFNEAAVPVLTFVPPADFNDLVGSLRTPGKHVTLSGASGCGKTTLAKKALDAARIDQANYFWISGRDYTTADNVVQVFSRALLCSDDESECIEYLRIAGLFVIDDFHHLKQAVRDEIGRKLKRWSELEIRILVIGISGTNKTLLDLDSELAIRNDSYDMRTQSIEFIYEVMARGEIALNFQFSPECRRAFAEASLGVPSAIQLICRVACTRSEIYDTQTEKKDISLSMAEIKDAVLRTYKTKYQNRLIGLAKGKQQARSVHNTYFEIVKQICTLERSEIPTAELYVRIVRPVTDPAERNRKSTSFYNCLKNFSEVLVQRGLDDAIYYNPAAAVISIEDPSFRLYLTLADLDEIERSIRVRKTRFPWDVAVSFAGELRPKVEELVRLMNNSGYSVFYDFDVQHKLWGENLTRKLSDVYATEAQYMVIFLSRDYPEKDWTRFELEVGRSARQKRTETYLLPVIVEDVQIVGLASDVGHLDLRRLSIEDVAIILIRKIEESENADGNTADEPINTD